MKATKALLPPLLLLLLLLRFDFDYERLFKRLDSDNVNFLRGNMDF
jgi:hypothetical protein